MLFNTRGLRRIAALALITVTLAANSAIPAQATGTQQGAPTITAGRELDAGALAQLRARPQGHPKIESQLNELIARGPGAGLAAAAEDRGFVTRADQVQVYVTVDPAQAAAVRQLIAAQGGEATGTSMDGTTIQAFIPVASLEQVADEAAVQFVRRPDYVEPMGELQAGLSLSEGVAVSNAAAWHAAGRRGAGIKVAVMDVGFEGYQELLGSDLPANVTAVNFVDTGSVTDGGPHGTACAEIVYDMAPGVQIMLLRVSSNIDVEEATNFAISQGAHIISASIGTNGITPGDGSGGHTQLVARARNAGIFWATAAGNERQKHWGGVATDSDGDSFVEYVAGGAELNCIAAVAGDCPAIPAGYQMSAILRWSDWQAPVDQDYALIIARNDGSGWQIFAVGDQPQDGAGGRFPVEFVSATSQGAPALYAFAIQAKSANTPVNFDLFVRGGWRLEGWVAGRSITDQSASPNIFVVGALDSTAPFPQEDYSSEGPTLGPGGAFNGGIIKPDLAAFANVNTEAYGDTPGEKFNGTSAATPHVAGAAALIRGAFTAYTPDQIASFLTSRAVDMGPAGKDTRFGFGRLWLGTPPTTGGGTTIRKRLDFNADGTADFLWRHASNGNNGIWFMLNGRLNSTAALPRVIDNNWRVVGITDFNGDRRSDILWRHSVTGSNAMWIMNGAQVTSNLGLARLADLNWRVAGTGDFNADGRSDILWRHAVTGSNAIWFMYGGNVVNTATLPTVEANWRIVGTGDFNGDRRADILWRHAVTGNNSMWIMSAGTVASSITLGRIADLNWRVAGTGDFNADGRSDILWRHLTTGNNALWAMSGGQVLSNTPLPRLADLSWRLVHDGDVNNDRRADIVWRNAVSGANGVWLMNGASVASSYQIAGIADTGWQMMGNLNVGTGSSAGAFSEEEPALPGGESAPAGEAAPELGELSESAPADPAAVEELAVEELSEAPVVSEADPSTAMPEITHRIYLPLLMR